MGRTYSTDTLTFELSQESLPTRIDVVTRETFLRIESHVSDVIESAWSADHALVDTSLLLLAL
jgi:hypothetical protein